MIVDVRKHLIGGDDVYKIKQVAELAGVSVRTLHHYDDIGLLKPEIAPNGYRLYSEDDFLKLQQILFFKELDFPLDEIKQILNHPDFDRDNTLRKHKHLLEVKKNRLEKIIKTVDDTLHSLKGGTKMSKEKMFNSFSMKEIEEHQKKYEKEVEERWGGTDAYTESVRKTKSYTEADWKRIHEEAAEITKKFITAMEIGPDSDLAMEACKLHRQHITDSYYKCTLEIYRGLGEMYVADERFTKNIDKAKEGLASFMREAMIVYCDRAEGK
ncbi:MAG: MerR family transcriptional regulator [Bacillales bacterium]|jgi:DNA-binding transcriptional MerR regulator|nr:MerR family transcriptional regulator [Bacillales bacterium]